MTSPPTTDPVGTGPIRPGDAAVTTAVRTVCSYCGVGCGIVLDVTTDDDGRRVAVRASGDAAHPANAGRLCTKGLTSADVLRAEGRVTTGLVRSDRRSPHEPCSTDEAIERAGRRLRAILDEHGPDALALYVSGQMTIEAQYLATKLAKGFIGTNQIESNSRLCMASAAAGYRLSLGADGPPGSYDDLDHADVFLVIGSNMADCHPVLFLRLLDRVRAGATLIVVDPRRTPTADKAHLHLQPRPGTDLTLLNGLLHLVDAGGHVDHRFVEQHTAGWDDMAPLLAAHPPSVVAAITGVAEDDLRAAAELIGTAGNWVTCWTMGLNQSVRGTYHTNAICNLHLATGAIGRRGSGPLSLTGQPNAMGGREMGYLGSGLPGQRSVLSAADRRFIEDVWGVAPGTVRPEPGPGTVELFGRMAAGQVKACWVICTNPVASVANRDSVIRGLEAAELVITQDAFVETETNAHADIVLPAAMWAEGDGVMVNSERTCTLAPKAVDPPGEARPDWQLIAGVARAMGFTEGFQHASAEEVFEEIRRCSNPATGYELGGVTYGRLREQPVQWPARVGGAARNPIRYVAGDGDARRLVFPTPDGRAVFHARSSGQVAELPDDDHPFTFNTGRLAHHWHTMTKTARVPRLAALAPSPFVEIHPADAGSLGIAEGDAVEVRSPRGRAVLPARVTDRVQPGSCFAPFHWNDLFGEHTSVNAVTDDAVDPISLQPGFKACAVSLTKLGDAPPSPASPASPASPTSPATPPEPARPGLWPDDVPTPSFDETQRMYLAGFLAGLDTRPARDGVPTLPPGAPFPPDVAVWVDGWLAGMCSRTGATAAPVRTRPVHVLWASQTGNARRLADGLAAHLAGGGWRPVCQAMDEAGVAALQPGRDVLVVSSTYGAGEPPDNGAAFWRALSATDAPRLDGVRYAVLALGDPSYAEFCGHGRRLDARLRQLGAVAITARAECEADDDAVAAAWFERVADALGDDSTGGERRAVVAPGRPFRACGHAEIPSRAAPLLARLAGNRLLTGPGSTKEVRELIVDTTGSALTYEAGDSLGVWPANCPDLVAEWIALMGADGDDVVHLDGVGALPLVVALRDHLEIARVTPELVRFLHAGGRPPDRRVGGTGNAALLARRAGAGQAIDLARESGVRADAATWLGVFTRLRPRQYSISSSPLVAPHRLRLTVSVLRFRAGDRARKGVCSTYLADSPPDGLVPVFVQAAVRFRPPADPSAPTVMIGPGTGVAPFLGFLEDRQARGHDGPNWLFFGAQRRRSDHLYERELERFGHEGVLHRLDVAFSRDQPAKRYVQDLVREHGAQLWAWLQEGAHVYVCGDRERMAVGVDAALRDVVAAHGAMTAEAADDHVRQLAAAGRYARDVY